MSVKQRPELTAQANRSNGRHGWLRLTPAYSVAAVEMILARYPSSTHILDPFAGTGTTGVVARQLGKSADMTDINPFLVWLARAKCATYTPTELAATHACADFIAEATEHMNPSADHWLPPIHNITRWWNPPMLHGLAQLFQAIQLYAAEPSPMRDILLIAFCRVALHSSNAAFNHQSLSFKAPSAQQLLFTVDNVIIEYWRQEVDLLLATAHTPIVGTGQIWQDDARQLTAELSSYDLVLTSPPYVNRMSYIRELRPYMYWLGYLTHGRAAGDLDWQAIGGTWGCATSRLATWVPAPDCYTPALLIPLLESIKQSSPLLSSYVQRYFSDMYEHLKTVARLVQPGGHLAYIIGNSKFYTTLIPTEQILAVLMHHVGFTAVTIEPLRKRNSKKELVEFLVLAQQPQ